MHQHGNGHGSNTARHRGEIPSSVGNLHISLATTSKPTKHNKCKCIQGDLLQRRTYIIVVHIAHKSLPRFLRRVRDWVYAWRGSVRKLPRINSIRMKVYIFCLYDIKVALEGETLPQSMTTAPGFTQLLLTIWGLVGRDIIWELKENDVIRVVHISIETLRKPANSDDQDVGSAAHGGQVCSPDMCKQIILDRGLAFSQSVFWIYIQGVPINEFLKLKTSQICYPSFLGHPSV